MENKGNNNNGGNKNNNNRNGMTIMVFILAALLVLFFTSLLNSCAKSATNKEISYSEFISMVENDKVEKVKFTSNKIEITPKDDNKLYRLTYYTAELRDDELLPLLREHNVKFSGTVEDVSSAILWNMVSYILPLVLVWVLLYFLIFRKMGGGGVMGVGKTTAKVYVEKSTGVTFKDVAGQDEAKESLQEVVDFLHNPKKYTDIGAKLPKGALLVGPPGTGKTLLAKAVAGEAKVPFFSLAGSDFVEMFVGVGASRVRDLFKEAQKQAPCIIFIDEIDAIGKSRDTRYGGNDEREQTLNQLLAEMDGFDTSKGLLILAATNRPEVLDKALLRPGRFDRRIIVDKPDLKGRVETLKVHAKSVLMDETVDLDAIALATSGAVGSDLANMINEAAINAVKHGRRYVNQGDLFESVEVVIAGKEKKDRIMGPKEKKMVAYHEVGHALVTALQKDAEPVQKITIVPRTMGALGYTMQVPEEEKFLMTKNELVAHLVTYMGGRAAEEIVFDSVTTGASNDIEQATKMARAMVTQYGMSEKFGLMGLVTVENKYLDGRASLNCGEETAAQIDQEVMKILKESYDKAMHLLQENRSILDEISQYLYEHETITGKEFMKIFRRLKGLPEPEEKSEAQKAAERFKVEDTYVRSGYQQQKVKNNQREEKASSGNGEESSQKKERSVPETKPLPPAQPKEIPAGLTVLEESLPHESSVQKPQDTPTGLTVLEETWPEEEMVQMPVLEENVDFRVPKFLQKQLQDVEVDDETVPEETAEVDLESSQEEQSVVIRQEDMEEKLPQDGKSKFSDGKFDSIAEDLQEESKTTETLAEEVKPAMDNFPEKVGPEPFAEKVEPVPGGSSERVELVMDNFSERVEPVMATHPKRVEPVMATHPEKLEEIDRKKEVEKEEDSLRISHKEPKKKSQVPKIRDVRTGSRKVVQQKSREESIANKEVPKTVQEENKKKTVVSIEPKRTMQEKLEQENLSKVVQKDNKKKIVVKLEPQRVIQEKPQEKNVPKAELKKVMPEKTKAKNDTKIESPNMAQRKPQEKNVPKAEAKKVIQENPQKTVGKKVSTKKVTAPQSSSEKQPNITKKVSRGADDFKELPDEIAVAKEEVPEAATQSAESKDSENYLDKLLKGLE